MKKLIRLIVGCLPARIAMKSVAGGLFIVPILLAVVPLFGKNYIPTHDGEYHIIRIVEFSKMLGAGYLVPRWAPDMNSGYGIPIFQYHYPLPDYVGSFVRLITHDAVYAFQTSVGLGYILAVTALFGWLFVLFGLTPAITGAIVGAYVPYWFVEMYVRGVIGEVWATAFLFAVLFFVEKKKYVFIALAYALLILSHNILAMVYSPFIFIYMFLRDRRALWMLPLGIGISAFFWLPAILESKFVTGLNTVNFREHFVEIGELLIPSWGTAFSGTGTIGNKISFQIGIIPLLVMVGSLFVCRREKNASIRSLYKYLLIVICITLAAMLSFSEILWEIIKPLQLVQYPWRFLAFVIPVSAFSAAFWIRNIKTKWLGIIIPVLAVICAYSYARPVLYVPRNEAYYMSRANFTDGTSSMGNSFSTIWTGWKEKRPETAIEVTGGRVDRKILSRYLLKEFTVTMDKPGSVTVNTLYFPGWVATIDAKEAPIDYQTDGIINLTVPEGIHTVRVEFTDTMSRILGNLLSVLSLAGISIWVILSVIQKNKSARLRH